MYGLIVSIMVLPANRDSLLEALASDAAQMPGCQFYVVGEDPDDESLVWISEAWESAAAHAQWRAGVSGLAMEQRAKPFIIGFGMRQPVDVVHGFSRPADLP